MGNAATAENEVNPTTFQQARQGKAFDEIGSQLLNLAKLRQESTDGAVRSMGKKWESIIERALKEDR